MTTNLPAVNVAELGKALATAKTRIAVDAGTIPFLRLLKSGEWVYSADDVDVQEGSFWAVNSASLSEGYAAWGGGELQGEQMAPMTGTPVVYTELPDVGAEWKKQVGFLLFCLNGEDKGTQVLYKTTSKGGLKAAGKLINAIIEQIDADPANIVPVVSLEMDSYKHKEYGKIYTPIFEVKDWMDFTGAVPEEKAEEPEPETETATEPEPEPEPKKKAATKKRRRAIAT